MWVRPRRARCGSCDRTHVLLPCRLLKRRRDAASDVGVVLEAYAEQTGYRRAARALDIPVPTARNWVRQLRGRWDLIAAWFDSRSAAPTATGVATPLDGVTALLRAAALAGWSAAPWEFASLATAGALLTNTS